MTTATVTTASDREARRIAAQNCIRAWLKCRWDAVRLEALQHAGHFLGERLDEADYRGEFEMRNLLYRLAWDRRLRRRA